MDRVSGCAIRLSGLGLVLEAKASENERKRASTQRNNILGEEEGIQAGSS